MARKMRESEVKRITEQLKVGELTLEQVPLSIRAVIAKKRAAVCCEFNSGEARLMLAVINAAITDLTQAPDTTNYFTANRLFTQGVIPHAEAVGINSVYLRESLSHLGLTNRRL